MGIVLFLGRTPFLRRVSTTWPISENIGIRRSLTLWGILVGRRITCFWGILVQKILSTIWPLRVGRKTETFWELAALFRQTLSTLWDIKLQTLFDWCRKISTSWSLCDDVAIKRFVTEWGITNTNPVTRKIRTLWDLFPDDGTRTIIHTITATVVGGSSVELLKVNISIDESSWLWKFTASPASVSDWERCSALGGVPVTLAITIDSYTWYFLVEGRERSKSFSGGSPSFGYNISGRSPSAVLGELYSDPITKTWDTTTARTVVEELCTAKGLTVSWNILDWPLPSGRLAAQDEYPIKIIQRICEAAGAKVQSSLTGSEIQVSYKYPVSPLIYASETPDHVLSDGDDLFSLSEQWVGRELWDTLLLSDTQVSTDDLSVSISALSDEGHARELQVSVVPWQNITMDHSALAHAGITYLGEETPLIEDELVAIIEGKGRVSKNYYGTESSSWEYTDLGALTIGENGSLSTLIGGQSLLRISYYTKYHRYSLEADADVPAVQVFVEE